MKRILPISTVLLVSLLLPTRAFADITAFLGVTPTPNSRPARGFAVGMGLLIVGFEFEYSNTSDDVLDGAPRLKTYMGNVLLQTPFPIAGLQFYGTAGAGAYNESFTDIGSETNVGINVGGGVKWTLAGPLRLRLDYRVFTLQGSARYDKPQRFYAGVNLKF
jgi:opacity protein-like surface antigen